MERGENGWATTSHGSSCGEWIMCVVRNFWINASKKENIYLVMGSHRTSNSNSVEQAAAPVPNVGKTRFDLFEYDIIKWLTKERKRDREKQANRNDVGGNMTNEKMVCVFCIVSVWCVLSAHHRLKTTHMIEHYMHDIPHVYDWGWWFGWWIEFLCFPFK